MKVRLLKDFKGLTKDKIYEMNDFDGQRLIDTRHADPAPRCFKIDNLCVAEIIELDKRNWKVPVRKFLGICCIYPTIGCTKQDVLKEGKGYFMHVATQKMVQTINDKYVLVSNRVLNVKTVRDYYKFFIDDMAKQNLSRENYLTEDEIKEKEKMLNQKNINQNINQL